MTFRDIIQREKELRRKDRARRREVAILDDPAERSRRAFEDRGELYRRRREAAVAAARRDRLYTDPRMKLIRQERERRERMILEGKWARADRRAERDQEILAEREQSRKAKYANELRAQNPYQEEAEDE